MIDIQFKINGRAVSPNRIGDVLEKAIYDHVIESVKKKLGSVRCPKHGKSPKVTIVGKSIDKVEYQITGCCQDVIDRTRNYLPVNNILSSYSVFSTPG